MSSPNLHLPTLIEQLRSIVMLKAIPGGLFSINAVAVCLSGTSCNPMGLSSGTIVCNAVNLVVPGTLTTYSVTTPFIPIDSATITSAVPTSSTCLGDTDGSITVTATPGPTTSLKYTLTPGALEITSNTGSATFTSLAADSYTVTVLDQVTGCFDTAMVDVTVLDPIGFSPDSTNPTCRNMKNGTITVLEAKIMGGVAPYTYSIGEEFIPADDTFEDLKPDTYLVTVKDANGCLSADVMVIIGKADRIKINNVIVMDATMPTFNDGSITIIAEAEGATMVWYSITGGAIWQNSAVFNGLDLGKYEIIVNELGDTDSKCASRVVHVKAIP